MARLDHTTTVGYQELGLHSGLSQDAQQLVRDQLDMQLADVHAMLRLPIDDDPGLRAGCNLAATQILLSVVSGVSTTLFRPSALVRRGNRGERFKDRLTRHYPWDQELDAPGRRSGGDAAADLYDLFRNPLVHSLGVVHTDTNPSGRMLLVVKATMLEAEIVGLEYSGSRADPWLEPTLILEGRALKLRVRSLYWGTRQMIEQVLQTTEACSFSFPRPEAPRE